MGEAKRRRLRGCTCPKAEGIVLPEHIEGCPARPKALPKFTETRYMLPVELDARISEEYALSPYHDRFTRGEFIALLLASSCERERRLREEKEAKGGLIEVHTQMPAGIEEASKRLEALKKGGS